MSSAVKDAHPHVVIVSVQLCVYYVRCSSYIVYYGCYIVYFCFLFIR